MNNFVFYSPTEFVFGKNTEVQVGALARKYGAQKGDDSIWRRFCCTEWSAG